MKSKPIHLMANNCKCELWTGRFSGKLSVQSKPIHFWLKEGVKSKPMHFWKKLSVWKVDQHISLRNYSEHSKPKCFLQKTVCKPNRKTVTCGHLWFFRYRKGFAYEQKFTFRKRFTFKQGFHIQETWHQSCPKANEKTAQALASSAPPASRSHN